jgi:hypothetical protein
MKEKFTVIEAKIDELVHRLLEADKTNKVLESENTALKSELNRLKKQLKDSQLGSGDTNEAVRRRLNSVMERLSDLESMAN